MKVTYYVASSVDGYIARNNGDVSWLDGLDIPMDKTGYDEFYSAVDALVMGRKTYEVIADFGAWPYGDKPTWICSNNNIKVFKGVNIQKGNSPETVISEAQKLKISHLWLVGGGNLASSFINKSFLTNIIISQMPIILGGGIPVFGKFPASKIINFVDSKKVINRFSQIEYSIKNA